MNFWRFFNELQGAVRKHWSDAGDLLRKSDYSAGYASSIFDTFPIMLVFGALEDGSTIYLGAAQAYIDIEKWMNSDSRQMAFTMLGIKKVFTETLSYHKW